MSSHLVCPLCSKPFDCDGPHTGPALREEPIKDCPLKKGSIYVFVKDERGLGIPLVKTYCDGNTGTDPEGFAFFHALTGESYETRIVVGESDDTVKKGYYAPGRFEKQAKVEPGKNTLVEFVLHRYAKILTALKRTDDKEEFPPVIFKVEGGTVSTDPQPGSEKGKAEFPAKFRQDEVYTVSCALEKETDAELFKIQTPSVADHRAVPDKLDPIVFVLDPRYWVEFALTSKKEDKVTGDFKVKHEKTDAAVKPTQEDGTLRIPDLDAGKMDVQDVTLADSREFVSLTTSS